MSHWPTRLLRMLDRVVGALSGLTLLAITVILFANSVARYFAGISFVGSGELARVLMVWLTFLGSYLLVRLQRHVCVDVLQRILPVGVTRALNGVIGLAGTLVLGYVAWASLGLALFVLDTGQMMSSLPVRRGWIYMAVPVGCGLMTLAYAIQLAGSVLGFGPPDARLFGVADPEAVEDPVDDAAPSATASGQS